MKQNIIHLETFVSKLQSNLFSFQCKFKVILNCEIFSWNRNAQFWPALLGISESEGNHAEMTILGGNCMLSFEVLIVFFKKKISLIAATHTHRTICKTSPNLGGSRQVTFFTALVKWDYWWTVSASSLRNGRIRINDYFGKCDLNH